MLDRAKAKPPSRRPAAKSPPYVLDEQVGFLLRVAMQRHTAIFMSQMVDGLTQTQFAALAKLLEVGPCSQNHLGRLIYPRCRHHQGRGRPPDAAQIHHHAGRSAADRQRAAPSR